MRRRASSSWTPPCWFAHVSRDAALLVGARWRRLHVSRDASLLVCARRSSAAPAGISPVGGGPGRSPACFTGAAQRLDWGRRPRSGSPGPGRGWNWVHPGRGARLGAEAAEPSQAGGSAHALPAAAAAAGVRRRGDRERAVVWGGERRRTLSPPLSGLPGGWATLFQTLAAPCKFAASRLSAGLVAPGPPPI